MNPESISILMQQHSTLLYLETNYISKQQSSTLFVVEWVRIAFLSWSTSRSAPFVVEWIQNPTSQQSSDVNMRIQVKTIQGLWISQYDVKKNWRLPSSLVSHDLKNSRLSRRSLDLLEEQDLLFPSLSLSSLSLNVLLDSSNLWPC